MRQEDASRPPMSSSSNYDTPSPRTHQSDVSQTERSEIPDSQRDSPVRRPSFEKLDATEVAKALQIADLLKTAKSGRPAAPATAAPPPKPKATGPKKPTPPPAEFIPRPPPIPFSGNTNPDAVALRATTDILQIQKARATENIQRLEQLKLLNRQDPKAFLKQLMAGNLKASETDKEGILGPTVGPEVEKLLAALEVGSKKETANSDADAGAEKEKSPEAKDESTTEEKTSEAKKDYPRFPTPQNVVRTPAINWAKYGILGDTLDNMHEEQKTNPILGEPERLASRNSQPGTPVVETDSVLERGAPPKAPKFVMAAPYDPMKDQLKKSRKPL